MRGILLILLALSPAAHAQTVKAQGPRGKATTPTYQPRQPYNSMAKDTTPLNCDQYRNHPYPNMQRICQGWENAMVQGDAQRQGRPGPSSDIVDLPPLGSSAAKQLGYACVGGQAMRKLPNGWEQLSSPSGGWQRCRGG